MKNATNYFLKFIFIISFFLSACETDEKSLNAEILVELDTTFTTIGTPINYKVTVNRPYQRIVQFTDLSLENILEVRSFSVKETDLRKIGQY